MPYQVTLSRRSDEEVTAKYGVSRRMYTYCVSMTRVNRQFR